MSQTDQSYLVQGFLLVREPKESEWKKIWFVLEEHQIVAYQDQKKKDILFQISLDHASVNPDPTTPSYKQHCFEVVIKSTTDESVSTYLFSATSKNHKHEWVENLLQQVYQGGNKKLNGSVRKSRKSSGSPRKDFASELNEPLKISFEDFPTIQFYNEVVAPKLQESNSNSNVSSNYNSFYTKNILLTKDSSTSSLSSVDSTSSSKSNSSEYGNNSNGGVDAEKWGMVVAPFTTVQDILKSLAVKLDREPSSLTMVAKDTGSNLELELQLHDKILNVNNPITKLVIRNKPPAMVKSSSSSSADSDKEHKESTKAKKIAKNLRVKSQMFLSGTIMKSNSNDSSPSESPKEGFGKKYLNFTAPRKKHDQRKTVALGNNTFENQTDYSSQDSPRSSSEDGVVLTPNLLDEDDPDVLEWNAGELLAGESIVRRKRLLRVVPASLSVPGTLFITTFRVFFVDQNAPKQMTISIPLGTINKISKNKKNPLIFQVSCRDMRIVPFEVPATSAKSSASEVIAIIHKYMPEDGEQAQLFAFNFKQHWDPEILNGWELYDPITDYSRMKLPDTQWRLTDVNKTFELSPTYPNKLVVPASVTDVELQKVGSFRSKGRIPVCVWVHPTNRSCLTRSSQPLVGVTRSKSSEDQKLLSEILATNPSPTSHILYISDARPKVNAQANQIKGMGYESPAVYTNCNIEFFNIANIHVMREAQKKLLKACQFFPFSIYNSQASLNEVGESSGWLEHIRRVLAAALRVAELLDKECTSVLSHCSDGWDRTSQVVGITELLLDPFYRTIDGFAILIEKEFLSFGHKMQQRTGHAEDVVNVKEKERAPIFLQFIDCVWQIYRQFPTAFEFDSKYLIAILDHSYSCLFGTFLYNCFRERLEVSLASKTFSLWTFIHYNLSFFKNPKYTPVSEPIYSKISAKNVDLWTEYYFRWKLSGVGNEFTPHDMKLVNSTLTTIPIDNNNNNNQLSDSNQNPNTISKHSKHKTIAVRFADDHQLDERAKSASDTEEMQEKSSKKKKKHHKKRAQSISE